MKNQFLEITDPIHDFIRLNSTEQKIIDNIKTYLKEKTMIMIAHRQTTIKDCDQIINLKNGVLEN